MLEYLKKLIGKNEKLYFKLLFFKKIGFSTWFLNVLFQRIFRRQSYLPFNINFTSTIVMVKNIEFSNDMNTLTSFAVSGHCYFQALNGIKLGEKILFAPGVKVISANHDLNDYSKSTVSKPIIIGDNVWIGANAIILPEVEIGNNCIVGAGSVVTKSFKENNLIIAGNPAQVIKRSS